MLDDYGQKWKHTPVQFELNRKFALVHNPTDNSMETGPGIYDNYSESACHHNSFEVRSLPVRYVTGGITQYVVNSDIIVIISSRERGSEFWDLKKSSIIVAGS